MKKKVFLLSDMKKIYLKYRKSCVRIPKNSTRCGV